ncbi:MAG TPA: TlpA disulfide reductase family protein [Bacteroidia bacterium]|nr:TlpA disulfide reductase family protein [Bacteroidia bacterium]
MITSRPLLLAIASLALLPLELSAQQKGIEGELAPPLNVSDWINLPEGKDKVELSDYKGKIVAMLFFQHWCQASQERELPVLKKLVEHYKGNDGIVFLAVQTVFEGYRDNTPDKLPVTAQKFGLDIPIGHIAKVPGFPGLSGTYKPGGTPWWVIVDRGGKVEYNGFVLNEEEAIKGFDKMLAGLPVD